MKDISIIIANRGGGMGLWATVHSCEIELKDSGIDYEYAIVCNGDAEKVPLDVKCVTHYLKDTGRLTFLHEQQEPLSPPLARQFAVPHTEGKYLCFFDNHCLVDHNYFTRALESLEKYDMDILHSAYIYYAGEKKHHEYGLTLEDNFWGRAKFEAKDNENPYRVAVSGHGGFFVSREAWNHIGGYWDGFKGYGGEEVYFDMKAWMMGRDVWLDPKVVHYHFAGNRGYNRHYTADYFRNMMSVAYIIGGEDSMFKVMNSFNTKYTTNLSLDIYGLMLEAEAIAKPHAEWLNSVRLRSLDDQLIWFAEHDVSF